MRHLTHKHPTQKQGATQKQEAQPQPQAPPQQPPPEPDGRGRPEAMPATATVDRSLTVSS